MLVHFFLSIAQSMIILNSEIMFFNRACGGDYAKTSRALSTTLGINGVIGLFANQILGKLSDVIGRKPLLYFGPVMGVIASVMCNVYPDNLKVLMWSKVLKVVPNTFSFSSWVAAHFDIRRVKAALNAKNELKKIHEDMSFSEKLKDEAEHF